MYAIRSYYAPEKMVKAREIATPRSPQTTALGRSPNPAGMYFPMRILADNSIRIPFFISVSVIAMLGILWYIKRIREEQRLALFALSLVFSGALGNLIDRIRFGEVIDFLDVFWKQHSYNFV